LIIQQLRGLWNDAGKTVLEERIAASGISGVNFCRVEICPPRINSAPSANPKPGRVDLRTRRSSKRMKGTFALNQENPDGQQEHDLPLV
jgi:hypothetical protein